MSAVQSQTEIIATPRSRTTVRPAKSLSSIKSLGDIPFVESSFDGEFDTFNGNHSNLAATLISTPRFTRTNTNVSTPNALGSPWSTTVSNACSQPSGDVSTLGLHLGSSVGEESGSQGTTRAPVASGHACAPEGQENYLESIVRSAGAIASMNDFVSTWAPTAHYVVVAAAALTRDAAAFATNLIELLTTERGVDPATFASSYYQLREPYASLLSQGDFNKIVYGQQGWTRASATQKISISRKADMEATWDDRQLVDSFVTLLRTAPGFIASSINHMTESEITSFCAQKNENALSVLFTGVLGSAQDHRPRLLAEVLKHLGREDERLEIFGKVLMQMLLGLALGSLKESATLKLHRFLLTNLSNTQHVELQDFTPVFADCVPSETSMFIQALDADVWRRLQFHCRALLVQFGRQLLEDPQQFGILNDAYLGARQREKLRILASEVVEQAVGNLLNTLRGRIETSDSHPDSWWRPNELIALKGSDLILMFNCFLPHRNHSSSTLSASPSNVSDEDEWCLDSIRSDLVPVMQGLAHSTHMRTDGWQIFRVGAEGLVTDLGSDMGLSNNEECAEQSISPIVALCDTIARYDFPTLQVRVEAAKKDAQLRGDHITMFSLQNADLEIGTKHVTIMNDHVERLKTKCRYLRDTLDQAARCQRQARERLSKLLVILDAARVHVWYDCEVRTSSLYARSRDLLGLLFPRRGESDDDFLNERPLSGENLSGSSTSANNGSVRSRRLSILSSHAIPESPYFPKDIFAKPKLTDKEVDIVTTFMRRNRIINVIPAEERFHRALAEVAILARKLMERDHVASYATFKRDRQYQTSYAQQNNAKSTSNRHSHHHRRSSLGLFDFFDSGSHLAQQRSQYTLHTATSTQFLGLATSSESLRFQTTSSHDDSHGQQTVGPPRSPRLGDVQALIVTDLLRGIVNQGTETDAYLAQIGCMLLEGDGQTYQPLFDDISMAYTPSAKLAAVSSLVNFTRTVIQHRLGAPLVGRSDVIHELSKCIGREPGTLYRDLQIIATLVNPVVLESHESFQDCCAATHAVMNTVVIRSMDYATRFMRYYLESTSKTASKVAAMGINDTVAIWEFCAKQGNPKAQLKLAELYEKFPHLKLDLRPLSRPGTTIDGADAAEVRKAVVLHWKSASYKL